MKLVRFGARRNRAVLSKAKGTPLAATRPGEVGFVAWDRGCKTAQVVFRGTSGPSQYEYHLVLTAEEVAELVRKLLVGATRRASSARRQAEKLAAKLEATEGSD